MTPEVKSKVAKTMVMLRDVIQSEEVHLVCVSANRVVAVASSNGDAGAEAIYHAIEHRYGEAPPKGSRQFDVIENYRDVPGYTVVDKVNWMPMCTCESKGDADIIYDALEAVYS